MDKKLSPEEEIEIEIETNRNKLTDASNNLWKIVDEFPAHFKILKMGSYSINYVNQLKRDLNGIRRRDRTFKNGSIVFADFGMNFGSEFSGPHYAIVLSKNDSKHKRTITVLPLTSKEGKDNLLLNFNIQKMIDNFLEDVRMNKRFIEIYTQLTAYEATQSTSYYVHPSIKIPSKNEIPALKEELKELDSIDHKEKHRQIEQRRLEYLNDLKDSTYARIDSITTIDKNKIFKSKGYTDPMGKIFMPESEMIRISKEIMKNYLF